MAMQLTVLLKDTVMTTTLEWWRWERTANALTGVVVGWCDNGMPKENNGLCRAIEACLYLHYGCFR